MPPTTLRLALSQDRLQRAIAALAALPARLTGLIGGRRRECLTVLHASTLADLLLRDLGLVRADFELQRRDSAAGISTPS